MEGNSELPKPLQMIPERLRPEGQDLAPTDRIVINRETDTRNSEVAIKIVYNKHRSEEESRGLERLYGNTDVFIPEVAGREPDYLKNLQRLSNGDITSDELLAMMKTKTGTNEYARDKSLFDLIHGEEKTIAIIDLPIEHPLYQRMVENKFPEIGFGQNFDQTLESVRNYNHEFASAQLEREEYMLEQLQELTEKLKVNHPKLKNKQNINALMLLGAGHEDFPDKLRNHFQSVKEASTTPRASLYFEEAAVKQMHGNEVDDDLLTRVLAERVLRFDKNNAFNTDDPVKDAISLRGIISSFSIGELKSIFERAGDKTEWVSMINDEFSDKLKTPVAAK
jgi:hypothetical protein